MPDHKDHRSTRRDDGSSVRDAIELLLGAHGTITSGQVATTAGVSRQAAYNHLIAMARGGELLREGAGRGSHYRRPFLLAHRYDLAGLAEDIVWSDERAQLQRMDLSALDNPKVGKILDFTFTEMLNNAIDHSEGSSVATRWFAADSQIAFEIEDDGVGVYRNMREDRGLATDFEAIGEISKGKQTTAPEAHSGLGIFFSSRMSSRFRLSSGHYVWTVDSHLDDQAIGWLEDERVGTLVRCEVDADTTVEPRDVFRTLAPLEAPGSHRSRVRVSLFEQGDFVSRSEAKRVGAELEAFDEVEIDFTAVDQVGQGFVDELFRVWQRAHPGTRLVPVNANPAIGALIQMTVTGTDSTPGAPPS